MTYYSFTSLSTVGFGDYHPRSNTERILCAFVLLFGVAIFSYIMGNFIEILDIYKALDDDLDDGDNLSKFFGLIKKFNGHVDIKLELKKEIEEFFDYKWSYDRNQGIDEDWERAILYQLPDEVQNKIYKDFLFSKFLLTFRDTFAIPKGFETYINR